MPPLSAVGISGLQAGEDVNTRAQIVAEARKWLGTPYQHQARLIGVGVDCIQLVVAVGIRLGLMPELERRWTRYARTPNPNLLRAGLERYFTPAAGEPQDGDIAIMAWRSGLPMHTGIITTLATNQRGVIHSSMPIGKVVEHAITDEWSSRIECYWSYRGISESTEGE